MRLKLLLIFGLLVCSSVAGLSERPLARDGGKGVIASSFLESFSMAAGGLVMILWKEEDNFHPAVDVGCSTTFGSGTSGSTGNGPVKEPKLIFEVKRWARLPENQ